MKVVRLYNIQWDTDGEPADELGLPTENIVIVDDDWNPEEMLPTSLLTTTTFAWSAAHSRCWTTRNSPNRATS